MARPAATDLIRADPGATGDRDTGPTHEGGGACTGSIQDNGEYGSAIAIVEVASWMFSGPPFGGQTWAA